MVKKIFLHLSLILFLTTGTFAQVRLTASADSSAYLIGDYIHYTIRVISPENYKILTPVVNDTVAGLNIINIENPKVKEKSNNKITIFEYVFSKYDSANVTIPAVTVKYKKQNDTTLYSALSNPVTFTVSILKVNLKKGIKDIKPPIKIPLNWWTIIIWILIILLLIGIGYYLYRKYRKKKGHEVFERKVIKLPPHITALNQLKKLGEQKLWQNGLTKEYHTEITEIIRKYFEERFNLFALELTTAEALELLKDRKEAEPILDITNNFLTNADLVKFAKFSPMPSVNEEMMQQAYSIIKKTIPQELKVVENLNKEETNV